MKAQTHTVSIVLVALVVIMTAAGGCTGTAETKNPETTAQVVTQMLTSLPVSPTPAGPGSACSPVTIAQTDGKQITLPCMPTRIIAANTDAAEMLIALGASGSIVGITETTKNVTYIMEKIPQAQSIGDWQTPSIERMLSLRPDAVISYASSRPKNLDQIIAANISIISLDCYRLPKLAQDARALGTLTGNGERAEMYARMVENTTTTVMRRVASIPGDEIPNVYFEGYSDFTAAGTGSGSDELLVMAGGKNIAAGLSSSSPKVSAEWVVAQRPQFIMKVISSKEARPYREIALVMAGRTGWSTISAVQQERIYLFNNAIGYGPKSHIGFAYTAKILHPELFTDLDPAVMLDDYAAQYVSGTNMTTMVYPDIL